MLKKTALEDLNAYFKGNPLRFSILEVLEIKDPPPNCRVEAWAAHYPRSSHEYLQQEHHEDPRLCDEPHTASPNTRASDVQCDASVVCRATASES